MEKKKERAFKLKIISIVAALLITATSAYIYKEKSTKIGNEIASYITSEIEVLEKPVIIFNKNTSSITYRLAKELNDSEEQELITFIKITACKIFNNQEYELDSLNLSVRRHNSHEYLYSRLLTKQSCI